MLSFYSCLYTSLHTYNYRTVSSTLACIFLVLLCLVLSCLGLSCLVLSCLVLSCLVLPCLVLSCLALSFVLLLGIDYLLLVPTAIDHFQVIGLQPLYLLLSIIAKAIRYSLTP